MEYKVCTLDYLLDKMQPYELDALLENIDYCVKVSWEQTRFITWMQAQSFSSKPIKPTDIIKFGWEQEKTDSVHTISNNDIERLKNKAQQIINKNNGRLSN